MATLKINQNVLYFIASSIAFVLIGFIPHIDTSNMLFFRIVSLKYLKQS
jgi:hypothetical protein